MKTVFSLSFGRHAGKRLHVYNTIETMIGIPIDFMKSPLGSQEIGLFWR